MAVSATDAELKRYGSGILTRGWFMEYNEQWPGHSLLLECEEVLLDEKTEYQHILVFRSKSFGNVLVLDGVIQITERDEAAYQEMIAHLPLFAHKNPKNVLIIGGGDGGVIREAVKHSSVESIVICEIDRKVIEAGKKYFPSVASAWNDSRVTLHVGDGAEYLGRPEHQGKFDVIITDSSDPVGPAQSLFESPFYRAMHSSLRQGGIACTQAESVWENLELIGRLIKDSLLFYNNCEYATTQIPTYPGGQIGFLLCYKGSDNNDNHSSAVLGHDIPSSMSLRYYNKEMHTAAFALPAFVVRSLDKARKEGLALREEKNKTKSS